MTQHNTTLKDRIIEIMTESTGISMLDSGGVNGRRWQQNRLIKEWDAIPVVNVEVWRYDDSNISYSVFHYLNNFLDITDESERLDIVMKDIMNKSDDPIYDDIMKFFARLDIPEYNTVNTYNYDNILDGVLQYVVFEVDGEDYILLQVHLGADVRGGYSIPRVFALPDWEYFSMAQSNINAVCGCSDFMSDDCGYHWYLDGSCPSPAPEWMCDLDNNRVICTKCGEEIVFSVIESC